MVRGLDACLSICWHLFVTTSNLSTRVPYRNLTFLWQLRDSYAHTLPLKQLRATHQSLVFFIVIGKHQTMNPNSSKSTYKSYKLLVHSTKPTLPLTSIYGSLFHGDARTLNWLGLVRVDSVLQHQVACEFMRWSGKVDAQLQARVGRHALAQRNSLVLRP